MSVRPILEPSRVVAIIAGDPVDDPAAAPETFREPAVPAQRSTRLQPLLLKEPDAAPRVRRTFNPPTFARPAPPRILISAEVAQRFAGPRLSIEERNGELLMFNRLNEHIGNPIVSFGPSAGLMLTATPVDAHRTTLVTTAADGRRISYVVDLEARTVTADDGRSAPIAHSLDELVLLRSALQRGDPEAARQATVHAATPRAFPALASLYGNDRGVLDKLEYIEVRHGIAGAQGVSTSDVAFVRQGAEPGVVINELSHVVWNAIARQVVERHAGDQPTSDVDTNTVERLMRFVFLGRADIDAAQMQRNLDAIERRNWFEGYRLPQAAYRAIAFRDPDSANELCSDVASVLTNEEHLYRILSYDSQVPLSYVATIDMARVTVRELNAARPRSRQIPPARLEALIAGGVSPGDLRVALKLDAADVARVRAAYLDVGRTLVGHFRSELSRAYPPRQR